MKNKFMVDPARCAFGVLVAILSGICIYVMFIIKRPGSAIVFSVLLFFGVAIALLYGTTISLDSEGLNKEILGFKFKSLLWTEVKEVGIAGKRVFNGNDPKKTGTLYLYFSQAAMNDDERFKMILEWPPKKAWFIQFNSERLLAVQLLWEEKIVTYNAGKGILDDLLKK